MQDIYFSAERFLHLWINRSLSKPIKIKPYFQKCWTVRVLSDKHQQLLTFFRVQQPQLTLMIFVIIFLKQITDRCMEHFWKLNFAVGIELLWTSGPNNGLSNMLCDGCLCWCELHVQITTSQKLPSLWCWLSYLIPTPPSTPHIFTGTYWTSTKIHSLDWLGTVVTFVQTISI